jgi:hypothetical protein
MIRKTRHKLRNLEVALVTVGKEKRNEIEVFNIQQEIKKQRTKLEELLEADKREVEIIQKLKQAKKELAQAQKELNVYLQKKAVLDNRAGELMNLTIPS